MLLYVGLVYVNAGSYIENSMTYHHSYEKIPDGGEIFLVIEVSSFVQNIAHSCYRSCQSKQRKPKVRATETVRFRSPISQPLYEVSLMERRCNKDR